MELRFCSSEHQGAALCGGCSAESLQPLLSQDGWEGPEIGHPQVIKQWHILAICYHLITPPVALVTPCTIRALRHFMLPVMLMNLLKQEMPGRILCLFQKNSEATPTFMTHLHDGKICICMTERVEQILRKYGA